MSLRKVKKKYVFLSMAIIVTIVAVLIGLWFGFNSKFNSIYSDSNEITETVNILEAELNKIVEELSTITEESEKINNQIVLLESKVKDAKKKIASNAWDILQIGDAATEALNSINDKVYEAEINYNYGHLSPDDYLDTLTEAMNAMSTYNSLISRATRLGEKYEPYIDDSIENNTPQLPTGDLTAQLNSLETENNNLIKQIADNENTIKKCKKDYDAITQKNSATVLELTKKRNDVSENLRIEKDNLKEINKKLHSFPYSLISFIKGQ